MPPIELLPNNADRITVVTESALQGSTLPIPFLLREAGLADAPQILRLSRLLDSINLPTEEQDLTTLIAQSAASFRGKIGRREEEAYLFVLEDVASRDLVGTAMILAKHGTPDSPHFYLEM